MFQLSRREILKGLACAGVGSFLPLPGLTNLAFGAAPRDGIMMVLHLRGGCDGLNMISPASDPLFVDARISELRVSDSGDQAGYSLANGPDKNIDFRLHPAAGGLNELYKGGNLAFLHACGLTNQTRSHFVATDMIDRGVASDADLAHTTSGWLTRSLGKTSGSGIPAVSATNALTGDLSEFGGAMAIPDLGGGFGPMGGAPMANMLWQLYDGQAGIAAQAGRMALQNMATVDGKVARDAQGHPINYQGEHNTNYDNAAEFARTLKTVAQLIKMNLGLRAITLEYGSWDTHEGQNGRYRPQVEKLSNGLSDFWNDLSDYHDRITLVVLTEFGRRLRGNKSNGTDHGRASLMMALGGQIAGGRFHGEWPGLKPDQLDEGVDLAVTTDYRRVLSEVLDHSYGAGAAAPVFPNFKDGSKLGLYA